HRAEVFRAFQPRGELPRNSATHSRELANRSLPWKPAVEFHFETETQKRPDKDDAGENGDADCRRPPRTSRYRPATRTSKQDGAANVLAVAGAAVWSIMGFQ